MQGAHRFAPKTFEKAQSSLINAELTIHTDRHNEELVTAVSTKATQDAQRALRVADLVRRSGRPGSEDMALNMVLQEEQISAMNQQAKEREAQLRAQQSQMRNQLAQTPEEREEEARKEQIARKKVDEVHAKAQSLFTKDEVQIHRQGNNLILRMNNINFAPGRSELPTASFETLAKVNRIIDELNARKIIVEGHTDATGNKILNQKISQERADAVAEFLKQQDEQSLSGGASDQNQQSDLQIEPLGYGDQYPIATNKTKEGRALNRRVDIIIAPEIITE